MTSIATRHVMQANKSKDTGPELRVRAALRKRGLTGYRLHWKKAPGRPDICFPGRKTAIFVNGCYWHRCPHCGLPTPKSNVEFWEEKFARNRARDERNCEELLDQGWKVLVVWECRITRDRFEPAMDELAEEVRRAQELPGGRGKEIGTMSARKLRGAHERLAHAPARSKRRR